MPAQVRALLAELAELRDKDAAVVRDALPILVKRATAVPLEGSSARGFVSSRVRHTTSCAVARFSFVSSPAKRQV